MHGLCQRNRVLFVLSGLILFCSFWICDADEEAYSGSAFEYMFNYKPSSDFTLGIQVDTESCQDAWSQKLYNEAIDNARLFARAGLEVTKSSDTALFDAFFNEADRDMVTTTYQTIIDILSPPSEIQTPKATYLVVITCRDTKKRCNPRDPQAVVAYLIKSKTLLHNETMAPIVICSENFAAFKPTPDPCNKISLPQDGQHRGASQALILLHELIHIDYISGPSLKFIGDHGHGSYGATALKNKVNTNGDMDDYLVQVNPTDNDDNYATMAAWAWMQHEQRHRCPNNYPLWNEVARLGSQGMSQLRTLLAEGDGEPGTKFLTDQELKDFVNGVGRPEDTAECDATCIPYT